MSDLVKISLGTLWDETIAFLRAELSLVLPVAFLGFGLPMILMLLAVPTDAAENGKLAFGPWMLWFLPCGLLSMIGSIGLSAMALHPGASVKECLGIAIARLPGGIGLVILNLGVQMALGLPLALATMAEVAISGAAGPIASIANLAVIAVLIWLFVRVMPVWALLAERPMTPWQAARGAFLLTRGQYRKLLLLRVMATCAGLLTLLALLIPIGAVFTILGRVTGATEVAQTLSFVATGAVFAVLLAIWTIYVARLYARLAAGSSRGI